MTSLPGFCTGIQLVTAISPINRAIFPLVEKYGHLQATRLILNLICIMLQQEYGQLVSIATILSQILMDTAKTN